MPKRVSLLRTLYSLSLADDLCHSPLFLLIIPIMLIPVLMECFKFVCFVQVRWRYSRFLACCFLVVNSQFFGFYFLSTKMGAFCCCPCSDEHEEHAYSGNSIYRHCVCLRFLFHQLRSGVSIEIQATQHTLLLIFSFHRCLLNSRLFVVEIVCIRSCNQGIWAKSRGLGLLGVCQFGTSINVYNLVIA